MEVSLPAWLAIAEKELGISEKIGSAHNPRILEYHKATSLMATTDETPWCSAFANWVMRQVGIQGTTSAAARSWLKWGAELDSKHPAFGCIVVLSRGNNPAQGHVGFYCGSTTPDTIRVLGGNQGDKVSIVNFKKTGVLSYRWPGICKAM